MMTDQQHPLVTDYLDRLTAEARRRLPDDRAGELVEDIRAHLAEAAPPGASEADTRNAVDRLGSPRELVDEAGGATVPPPPTAAPTTNRLEIAALVCLVASLPLVVVFPLAAVVLVAGLVLLLLSRRWTVTDKVLGVVAYAVLGFPLVLLSGLLAFRTSGESQTCTQQVDDAGSPLGPQVCSGSDGGGAPWLTFALLALWLAFQVYVAVRLARHARTNA